MAFEILVSFVGLVAGCSPPQPHCYYLVLKLLLDKEGLGHFVRTNLGLLRSVPGPSLQS